MNAITSRIMEDTPLVADLAAISLDDLNGAAALQERVDRKYVLTEELSADMLDQLGSRHAVLDIDGRRSFGYESVYFDTVAFESYLGAAHRRRRRFKVRTRSYLDSQTTMLEVKTRGARGRTIKRRQTHDFDLRRHLGDEGRAFVDNAIGRECLGGTLLPTLTSEYRRTTLVDLDEIARLTIDFDLRCSDWNSDEVLLANRVVVETKSAGAPSSADRWLWSSGIRPEKISKFATCLAALHPELPSNKWHRTLQRYFAETGAARNPSRR
jgi:hypothetical protein